MGTSSDTSVASGESIGRVEFKSNDVSTGGNNVMGFVDCLATNAGTTYALTLGTGLATAATEKMRIDQNGNVGIGVTNPGSKLDVGGNIKVSGSISMFNGVTQVLNIGPSGSSAYINTGTSGGTVQFGAPAQNVTNINVQGLVTAKDINTTGSNGYLINGMAWALENSGVLTLGDWDGNEFPTRIMDNNSNEVLRVTDGNVGIGTTTPNKK